MSERVLQHDVVEVFRVAKDRMVSVLCLCLQKGILSYGQKSRYCDICISMVFHAIVCMQYDFTVLSLGIPVVYVTLK